tara:strand:+ start:348 stop:827 length:480 start_codon:yes stop_codon:yes gene_type:complete
MTEKNHVSRLWFYFRNGYGTYFAFILAAINTLTVTYYLAIEKFPPLETVFPSFGQYVLIIAAIGIPLLISVGFVHFKRTTAFKSEMDIQIEANPYVYKLPPNGWWQQAFAPLFLMQTKMILKMNNNEKLDEEDLKKLKEIEEKIQFLIKGGMFDANKKI